MSDYQHLANNAIIKPHIILISFAHISLFCCCLLLPPFVSRCSGSCNCLVWFNNVFCGFCRHCFHSTGLPISWLSILQPKSIYIYIIYIFSFYFFFEHLMFVFFAKIVKTLSPSIQSFLDDSFICGFEISRCTSCGYMVCYFHQFSFFDSKLP